MKLFSNTIDGFARIAASLGIIALVVCYFVGLGWAIFQAPLEVFIAFFSALTLRGAYLGYHDSNK